MQGSRGSCLAKFISQNKVDALQSSGDLIYARKLFFVLLKLLFMMFPEINLEDELTKLLP